MKSVQIVVAGVADQPVYEIASRLAEKAMGRGLDVAVSGSPEARAGKGVTAVVRWGQGALSPLVGRGRCTAVIGLEALEGVRQAVAHYSPGLTLILSTRQIPPTSVLHKGKRYPDMREATRELETAGIRVISIDAAGRSDMELVPEIVEVAVSVLL
ncbi:hypothetical protein [Caldinitratiruptor microaerophilus]|uniref:Uncharacterized protein n=1 Tax=Caldinitratiruptor microaerophilus TaxID=671077 RepID=A0AA35CIX6_9FIRM|nr:hypothetical protein [Caldinitratiruptor microaerophilus]BDG59183.1 hypothetical protein caldi_02730 [Caldinitratiruptor microaerophilus]